MILAISVALECTNTWMRFAMVKSGWRYLVLISVRTDKISIGTTCSRSMLLFSWSLVVYVWIMYLHLSCGGWMEMMHWFVRFNVSEYWIESNPIISGEPPYTKSNYNVMGLYFFT